MHNLREQAMSVLPKLQLAVALFGFIALVVGGVGLCYWAYCGYFSGSSVAEFMIFDESTSRSSFGSVRTQAKKAKTYAPVKVYLCPDMNPIAFTIDPVIVQPTFVIWREARYEARLTLHDNPIWVQQLRLFGFRRPNKAPRRPGRDPRPARDRRVAYTAIIRHVLMHYHLTKTFSVTEPGEYQFDVKREGGDLNITRLTLKVRRNVTAPRLDIVLLVLIMLGIGFTGAAILGILQVLKPQND